MFRIEIHFLLDIVKRIKLIRISNMEEKDGDAPCDNPFLGNVDYDNMTEEEYYAEMEKKVEYYKKNYPDMYEKAQQWIKMLDHSQVYKENSGED